MEPQQFHFIQPGRLLVLPMASVTAQVRPSRPKAPDTGVSASGSSASAATPAPDKPAHDVVAGAMARAASQSTIHPLDTMKVRMQAGRAAQSSDAAAAIVLPPSTKPAGNSSMALTLQRGLAEVGSLYKGVVSAATGAGIIIGAYFAFYSTTKRFLREQTKWKEGQIAFVAGATAAIGSGVVKVPIAVCIRSVQAGVYPNVVQAARTITAKAGPMGLFTGFLPTLLEDVPDMAVKFAVYESMRITHSSVTGGRQPSTLEDLVMGGSAGAAAAAATTPLDVVKTRMMCTASSRPTLVGAARSVMAEGDGLKAFFRGVGPRALSNGINSAVFFCFFEAIRRVLISKQQKAAELQAAQLELQQEAPAGTSSRGARQQDTQLHLKQQNAPLTISAGQDSRSSHAERSRPAQGHATGSGRLACLSLALPLSSRVVQPGTAGHCW